MNRDQAYEILKEVVLSMHRRGERVRELPPAAEPEKAMEESGIDLFAFTDIVDELAARFRDRDFHLGKYLVPEEYHYLTIGGFLDQITNAFRPSIKNPVVVYVDDEEENLFIFKRKFGKSLNLKTFTNPLDALDHVKINPDVGLVITDEVMPKMSGNELCDEIHKTKPNMKFILITGNPNQDDDLMYRSLRKNRFYEFINKPMNLEKKGEEYLAMIQGLLLSE